MHTLAYLLTTGLPLELFCKVCYRRKHVPAEEAVSLFGSDVGFGTVQQRSRCSNCGSRGHSLIVQPAPEPGRRKAEDDGLDLERHGPR